jgi:hypothetical protein
VAEKLFDDVALAATRNDEVPEVAEDEVAAIA